MKEQTTLFFQFLDWFQKPLSGPSDEGYRFFCSRNRQSFTWSRNIRFVYIVLYVYLHPWRRNEVMSGRIKYFQHSFDTKNTLAKLHSHFSYYASGKVESINKSTLCLWSNFANFVSLYPMLCCFVSMKIVSYSFVCASSISSKFNEFKTGARVIIIAFILKFGQSSTNRFQFFFLIIAMKRTSRQIIHFIW